MSQHAERAKAMLTKAQNEMDTAEEPDSFEVAIVAALVGIGEAILENAHQEKLGNEAMLLADTLYEGSEVNPTELSAVQWTEDLYRRIVE